MKIIKFLILTIICNCCFHAFALTNHSHVLGGCVASGCLAVPLIIFPNIGIKDISRNPSFYLEKQIRYFGEYFSDTSSFFRLFSPFLGYQLVFDNSSKFAHWVYVGNSFRFQYHDLRFVDINVFYSKILSSDNGFGVEVVWGFQIDRHPKDKPSMFYEMPLYFVNDVNGIGFSTYFFEKKMVFDFSIKLGVGLWGFVLTGGGH
jgi:hypothetical protein